ncbi:hypothetical protein AWB76_00260 [Caballeronia temeraria]|uniref:Uncharacterized protein n=1 Tax=Caballeronia temeraria TaxID=1777137 RepID=A0A157Z6W9_9BURK|nr:hypothetical protein AWB76_00260 [Caballeronia temeraria]
MPPVRTGGIFYRASLCGTSNKKRCDIRIGYRTVARLSQRRCQPADQNECWIPAYTPVWLWPASGLSVDAAEP